MTVINLNMEVKEKNGMDKWSVSMTKGQLRNMIDSKRFGLFSGDDFS